MCRPLTISTHLELGGWREAGISTLGRSRSSTISMTVKDGARSEFGQIQEGTLKSSLILAITGGGVGRPNKPNNLSSTARITCRGICGI